MLLEGKYIYVEGLLCPFLLLKQVKYHAKLRYLDLTWLSGSWVWHGCQTQACHFGLAIFHQGQSNKALELPQK